MEGPITHCYYDEVMMVPWGANHPHEMQGGAALCACEAVVGSPLRWPGWINAGVVEGDVQIVQMSRSKFYSVGKGYELGTGWCQLPRGGLREESLDHPVVPPHPHHCLQQLHET